MRKYYEDTILEWTPEQVGAESDDTLRDATSYLRSLLSTLDDPAMAAKMVDRAVLMEDVVLVRRHVARK
jgi:hypothetical protein